MGFRSIEVYYDISSVPSLSPGDTDAALAFRSEAIDLINEALTKAEAGRVSCDLCEQAETDLNELNFGFDVLEFGRAETVIRAAVKCTIYDHIRKIKRYEFH